MTTILTGLALQFFRGIGPEKQRIGPFKKFNFFIGPNNAGKSTVIDFMYTHIPFPSGPIKPRSDHPDEYRGTETGNITFEVGFPAGEVIDNAATQPNRRLGAEELRNNLALISKESIDGDLLWVAPQSRQNDPSLYPAGDWAKIEGSFPDRYWRDWSLEVSGTASAFKQNFERIWKSHTGDYLRTPQKKPVLIPANRVIGPKDQPFDDFSERGLIDELVRYQNPKHDEDQHREVFRRINRFVATVLEREKAHIEIPHDREHIAVHIDNKVLPLSSLGTGIHEVILIAAACTITRERIVCLEEPETHLHVTSRQVVWLFFEQLQLEIVPVLQRLQGRLAAQG